jgi:Ca2+-binding EF-hand superfamily protein
VISFLLSLFATVNSCGVDVLFPDGGETRRLRVVATTDGFSPEFAWGKFLDKLFDHFDRNGDGFLSETEAARVFPLPLPDGRSVKMEFAKLDANKDGKASREEFKSYCRKAGFAPVIGVIRPPTAEQRRTSTALFRYLDLDSDGKLSRAELEKAPALLRRFDENEDEILTPAELLALEPADKAIAGESVVKAVPTAGTPAALLRLELGKDLKAAKLEVNAANFKSISETRFSVPGGLATITTSGADRVSGFRSAKAFYIAQFSDALGSKAALLKSELESDAALQALVEMFDAADRDGDGKLTAAELRTFLDLIEMGLGCQVVLVADDRGANLFDLLDANGDGVLDVAELTFAARSCEAAAALPLKQDTVPHQFRFSLSRGSVGASFGPVPIPAVAPAKSAPVARAARGPRWFLAMDKNGDGFVSAAEFLGPPELFRKLDTNGDGRISAEEAEQAELDEQPNPEKARKTIERGLDFLQKDAVKWRKERECATCHHGTMTVWVFSEAKAQGYVVDKEQLADTVKWTRERLKDIDKPRDTRPGWNMVSTPAVYLSMMALTVPKQDAISADELKRIAGHLVRHQEADGSWAWSLAPAQNRPPPAFESDEVVTLMTLMALESHIPPDAKKQSDARDSCTKAEKWLEKEKATETTQSQALRLFRAVRAGKSANSLQPLLDGLFSRQNKDGGWGQDKNLPSDAFATGQALYFLSLAGVKADRAEIQRGVAFLIATQKEDGSWPMTSRAHPGATPMKNPVPITYFGSAWATLGLLRSVSK